MIYFSQNKINELIETLENTHWFFIASHINKDLISKKQMADLVRMGFKESQVVRYPELAMQFGMLSTYLKDVDTTKITFDGLKKIIKSKKFLPLSLEEKFALQNVEQRAFSDIKGLGNKISKITHNILIEADSRQRHRYEEIIRNASVKAIEKREGVKFIVNEIGKATGDWSRDLDRIGDYILHESYNIGRAMAIKKQKGNKAKVYVRVHKNACESCKKLFLKNRKTWEPKIFTVNELLANGTNVGRNKNDWKATLSPVHPWCKCDVVYIQDGYIWSPKSQRFVPDENIRNKNEYEGKIKVTVTKT